MGVLQAGVGIGQPETWFFGEEHARLPSRFLPPAAKRSQDGPSAASGAGRGPCSPPCILRSLVAAAAAPMFRARPPNFQEHACVQSSAGGRHSWGSFKETLAVRPREFTLDPHVIFRSGSRWGTFPFSFPSASPFYTADSIPQSKYMNMDGLYFPRELAFVSTPSARGKPGRVGEDAGKVG